MDSIVLANGSESTYLTVLKTSWGGAIIYFWGHGRPRGPQTPLHNGGREAPRLVEWFLGPPWLSRPPNSMISGPSRPPNFMITLIRSWGYTSSRYPHLGPGWTRGRAAPGTAHARAHPRPGYTMGRATPGTWVEIHTWVFDTWFVGRLEIVDFFEFWRPPRPIQQVWVEAPPPSGTVFGAAGAAQTQQNR